MTDHPYPVLPAFAVHTLKVGDGHRLYVEESGNPAGIPVAVFHGGPGGGCHPSHRRFFDPDRYRVVLFDQRGAGKSTPHAHLEANTTWHLVDDAEHIREHLGIDRWLLFGGSWGSTLALTYAVTHPGRCLGLVLRGIFLMRAREVGWFYQHGASELFPDAWEDFIAPIPEGERHDLVSAYHRRLTEGERDGQLPYARAWTRWELSASRLKESPELVDRIASSPHFSLALARIEAHYFVNGGFFDYDGWLLDAARALEDLPCAIVQGRYDMVCPPRTAWELSRALPGASFHLVPEAGHASSEPGIAARLLEATDGFARRLG